MKEKDEKITKEKEYVALLVSRLVDATSRGVALESQVKFIILKLDVAKVWATEVKATSTGTQAVKEHRKSEDFKGEFSEATYDAFLKGFAKCKAKVIEAFPDLDLKSIIAKEPEQ